MPRSTVEPDVIQLRRTRIEDDGTKLDLLVHWNITTVEVEDIDGTHTEYDYDEENLTISYDGTEDDMTNWLSENQKQLVLKAKAKWEKRGNTIDDEDKADIQDIKDSIVYAQINDIDTDRVDKKYVQVKRTVNGQTFYKWCYVTYSVLLAYQNSSLAINDYVIIDFIDGDMDKPILLGKVIF